VYTELTRNRRRYNVRQFAVVWQQYTACNICRQFCRTSEYTCHRARVVIRDVTACPAVQSARISSRQSSRRALLLASARWRSSALTTVGFRGRRAAVTGGTSVGAEGSRDVPWHTARHDHVDWKCRIFQ